jgi:acetyl-CoA acetyltransferase
MKESRSSCFRFVDRFISWDCGIHNCILQLMREGMRGRYAIAGVGQTAFGKLPGRTTVSMNVEAARAALADAGIEKDAVDALYVKTPTSDFAQLCATEVAAAMGLQPAVLGSWDAGGASAVGMIAMAAMAIEAGQAEVALVTLADNPRTGSRQGYARPIDGDDTFGYLGAIGGYALIARRHLEEFGTTTEQLGAVAVAARRHGAANPRAQLRKPIDLADHAASPLVVDPLRRDDCCLVSDGGAAVVVTRRERARDGVPILGFGQGNTAWDVALRPDLTGTAAAVAGRIAFAMAGIRPADVDVAQLYDAFSIVPLMTLEDYGFCAKGEGGEWVSGGRIEIGGELPLNTSGGLLSETGMPGLQLVLEAVRQVRGEAASQVEGAGTCVVSGQGGAMQTHATLVLGG